LQLITEGLSDIWHVFLQASYTLQLLACAKGDSD